MADPLVLNALQEATRAMTQVAARLDVLEETTDERLGELKSHIDSRIGRLEAQMGTMNAHLDNIAREASITNELLRTDHDERKAERARKQKLEDEERLREQKLEDEAREDDREERKDALQAKKDLRTALASGAQDVWAMFKQPLAYLVTAALGFMAWYYFVQYMPQQIAPAPPGAQIEEHD
jgi:hypothetical protein